tara:strand:- start:156 stop:587 length:432 start_codon:yes stop_codon:yes gene_type:complete
MARPKKEIDYEAAARLARIHCTNEEIADCLDLDQRHFYRLLKSDPRLEHAIEKARSEGRASLRRLQWQTAANGSTSMQIWLGKQLLNQKDKQHQELTGNDGEAIRIEEESEAARAVIEAAINRAAKRGRESESHIETDTETAH